MSISQLYDVQRFGSDGYLYGREVYFQLIPHDPKREDQQVVVKISQPLLSNKNINEFFVRIYPYQNTKAVGGMDFSYMPDSPTRCEESMMRLKQMNANGNFTLEKEIIMAHWGTKTYTRFEPYEFASNWNDSYWAHPHEYLNLIMNCERK